MISVITFHPRNLAGGMILVYCITALCRVVVSFTSVTTSTMIHQPVKVGTHYEGPLFVSSSRTFRTKHTSWVRQSSVQLTTTTPSASTTASNTNLDYECIPLLNFRDRNDTINYIDRLDDAIMGGISTSTVRQQYPQQKYAVWNGVCRTDGGGFCGFRTNPFTSPFVVNDALDVDGGGFYLKCRFVSDDEPERRVWKLSTRTKPDRGELLYQAPFEITKSTSSASIYDDDKRVDDIEWQTIYVPFDRFRLVRGPQVIENGTPLNLSAGIYQLGMTMSQFVFAAATNPNNNTRSEKTLPSFRDGYFELHIEEMGVYGTSKSSSTVTIEPEVPPLNVLSKVETKEKRSALVKALFVVAKLFFSEQSQRRKSVMRLLKNKYKMTQYQAMLWGFRRRLVLSSIQQNGSSNSIFVRKLQRTMSSMLETISILSIDTIRSILSLSIKLFLFYPIRLVSLTLALFKPKKSKIATTP